jgi:hypothetical protein
MPSCKSHAPLSRVGRMKSKKPRNLAASHRAKLLTLAQERKEDFQFLLGRWTVERFLFRLGQSRHKDRFILKGAILFIAWAGKLHRPTKDLDLLGRGAHDVSHVVDSIRDICAVECEDGLEFDLAAIEGWRIAEDAEYEGVRVKVPASLDGARVQMQIDVGFGDAVEPAPKPLTFPVLLPLEAPTVNAYPPEAVVAEKFHAMVRLGIANSRMKDFFDIWTLASTYRFESTCSRAPSAAPSSGGKPVYRKACLWLSPRSSSRMHRRRPSGKPSSVGSAWRAISPRSPRLCRSWPASCCLPSRSPRTGPRRFMSGHHVALGNEPFPPAPSAWASIKELRRRVILIHDLLSP